MKKVRQYLQDRSRELPQAKQLERFFTKKAKHVGLLVSERVINIPMDLVPALYKGLFEEISWATEDEVCCSMIRFLNTYKML
jgi:protein BCP1